MGAEGVTVLLETIEILHSSERNQVTLLRDTESGERFVCKEMSDWNPIYEQLRELHHPYLPRIWKAEWEGDRTVVLEEYIEGTDLGTVSLSERQLTRLLLELCDVLSFLHSKGILHRDIKPSNLMLAPDGHLRLIDFDAAREEKPEAWKDTRLLGTRGYAPPEQYGFSQTDARADIYALGVTFRQLLGPLARRSRWKGILRKCTALDPKDRYDTTAQIKRAVYLGRVRRWLLRPLVALAGLYVVFWIGVGVFAYYHSDEVREVIDTVGFTNRHYVFGTVDIEALKKADPAESVVTPVKRNSAPYAAQLKEAYPDSIAVFSGYADESGRPLFALFEWEYTGSRYSYGQFQGLWAVSAEGTWKEIPPEECDAQPGMYAPAILAVYKMSIFDTPLF